MVRGHPAGGTVKIKSGGKYYGCREKPLASDTSYRDPGVYHIPGVNVRPGPKVGGTGSWKLSELEGFGGALGKKAHKRSTRAAKALLGVGRGGSAPWGQRGLWRERGFSGEPPSVAKTQKVRQSRLDPFQGGHNKFISAARISEANRILRGERKKRAKKPPQPRAPRRGRGRGRGVGRGRGTRMGTSAPPPPPPPPPPSNQRFEGLGAVDTGNILSGRSRRTRRPTQRLGSELIDPATGMVISSSASGAMSSSGAGAPARSRKRARSPSLSMSPNLMGRNSPGFRTPPNSVVRSPSPSLMSGPLLPPGVTQDLNTGRFVSPRHGPSNFAVSTFRSNTPTQSRSLSLSRSPSLSGRSPSPKKIKKRKKRNL